MVGDLQLGNIVRDLSRGELREVVRTEQIVEKHQGQETSESIK